MRLEDSAYVTAPPELPGDAALPDDEAIAPTAFRRAVATDAVAEVPHQSPLKAIVGTVLALLVIVSSLMACMAT